MLECSIQVKTEPRVWRFHWNDNEC